MSLGQPANGNGTATATSTTNTYSVAKKNVIKTALLVFGCFVMCSTCNQIFITLFFVGYPTNWNSDFYHFTVFATFSNCCLNPFIYALKYKEFQIGFSRFVSPLFGRKSAAAAGDAAGGHSDNTDC